VNEYERFGLRCALAESIVRRRIFAFLKSVDHECGSVSCGRFFSVTRFKVRSEIRRRSRACTQGRSLAISRHAPHSLKAF